MNKLSSAHKAADFINQQIKQPPKCAIILGSGLGAFEKNIQHPTRINYRDIPNFPHCQIEGHAGELIIGQIGQTNVACLSGRIHYYEGASSDDFKTFVRTLKLIGCETLLITNCAGSFHSDHKPGNLMLITDHINMQGFNPLIGENQTEFGERFPSMDEVYDARLQKLLKDSAAELNINLPSGIYLALSGPCFETPAEIKAYRTLGADVVGMSSVPEAIIAHHCGLKIATLSIITNLAAGMNEEKLTHQETLQHAQLAKDKLAKLLNHVIDKL